MTERLAYPLWMSAVNNAMQEINNRFMQAGMNPPPLPMVAQASYALWCDVPVEIAAAMLVRDAMEGQRRMNMMSMM